MLNLADSALLPADSSRERLDAIEQYSLQFGKWYQGLQDPERELCAEQSGEQIQELLKKHERIIMQVQEMQKDTSLDMVRFQEMAKGIMAYVDLLPKRVSLTKTKKG